MVDEEPSPEEGADEERLTARERRARRVKSQHRRELPKRTLKRAAIVGAAVLLVAGGVWAWTLIPSEAAEIHDHAALRMYVESEEISFAHPAFDLGATQYKRGHFHNGETYRHVLHIEGKPGLTLGRFFESIKVNMAGDHVKLDQAVHAGRDIRNNETHAWQLWLDRCVDGPNNWVQEPSFEDYQPKLHDRMLIIYAARSATAETLQTQMATVPTDSQIQDVAKDTCPE